MSAQRTAFLEKALLQAIRRGDNETMAQILLSQPSLIDARFIAGGTALHLAASSGHSSLVPQLLAASPQLVDAVDVHGATALHFAALGGNEEVVNLLLAASPNLINVVDSQGITVLHSAISRGFTALAERLLAVKPELIFVDDKNGNTVLHLALWFTDDTEFITKLWRLNPDALHAANVYGQTPLYNAVSIGNDFVIDLLQWKLTFDEVANAFTACNKSYEGRLRPIIKKQCECLAELLNRDVTGTVFEYLGFERSPHISPVES